MKKGIKGICCILAAVLMLCSIGFAAESETMQLDWEGDYAAMELVVTVKSPVGYNQRLTVALYPVGIENPTFFDYVRVEEATAYGREPVCIRLPISDALDAKDGAYQLRVQGNGYRSESSLAEETVYVLRPSDISGADGLLGQINRSGASEILPYLKRAAAALQMPLSDTESTERLRALIRVRDEDYNGSFQNMNEVRSALRASEVLESLEKGGLDAAAAAELVESIADLLNLDLSDAEYTAYRTEIYQSLIVMTSANQNLTLSALSEMLTHQAKWLAIINGASLEEMENQIKTLYKDLGISQTKYDAYASCNASNRQKILRQLYAKNFTNVEDVKKAFHTAVDQIAGTGSNSSESTGPSGSSGGLGGRGGGVSGGTDSGYKMEKPTDAEEETKPDADPEFSDCKADHWGYSYVKALKNSGMIDGYPDGSFRPEQSVSREEFVKLAVTASGLYKQGASCEFSDVPQDAWYYGYIAAAYRAKLIDGISQTTFGVGNEITREDVAVIVYRILKQLTDAEPSEKAADFADSGEISDYAAESVAALSDMHILNGYEDGTFRPKSNLTRAEAAKMICMLKEQIRK